MRKADEVVAVEALERHEPLVLHRHQHRVRRAMALGEREVSAAASNFAISTTPPPIASVGKNETSVVLE